MFPRVATLSLAAALALAAPAVFAQTSPPAAAPAADASPRFVAAQANAGEPVERVRFLLPIDSYEVVDSHAVLVWETHTKAWLVDLRESTACRHLDRSLAVSIDTMSDSLNTRNGFIVGRDGVRCRITQIREVDVPGMRAAERGAQVASGG